MDWAGKAIEDASGMDLEEFMKKNIFSKLHMNDTTFKPECRKSFKARRTKMAWRVKDGHVAGPSDPKVLTADGVPFGNPAKDCCGGVGLYSTPDDIAKFFKMLLNPDGRIISKASIDEMLKPQLVNDKWFVDVVVNGEKRSHLGQTWPAGTQATFGLSASINLENFPGRRPKNCANWSGMPGCHTVSHIILYKQASSGHAH
jgi:CubicO group peptidase (beta-lactamase class C family)